MAQLLTVRIYDKEQPAGFRILTDRLWPRGVSKVNAALDLWAKTIAPSSELRKWFNHEPERFPEFTTKYLAELQANPDAPAFVAQVKDQLQAGQDVLLLFGARDLEHNQAVVLKDWLQPQL
ncbi:DUF488 domain-containing protein [Lacticaseibacillus zhaodongensis]|uniref:DUF488 domain-containing protein n=1 Tax=Lacticaseibacillus zhaodongensis TaxID=2668065 RepID=UPI0012D2E92A|nr:DUF488 family protein [Lacticaseibacillus zhaodongensis]